MAPFTAQAATAEALRQNQEHIEEFETIVWKLQETIRNGLRIVFFECGESLSTLITLSLDDMSDAKVRLLNPFTGKSSEYAPFMVQCSLVFAARSRAYAMDE